MQYCVVEPITVSSSRVFPEDAITTIAACGGGRRIWKVPLSGAAARRLGAHACGAEASSAGAWRTTVQPRAVFRARASTGRGGARLQLCCVGADDFPHAFRVCAVLERVDTERNPFCLQALADEAGTGLTSGVHLLDGGKGATVASAPLLYRQTPAAQRAVGPAAETRPLLPMALA